MKRQRMTAYDSRSTSVAVPVYLEFMNDEVHWELECEVEANISGRDDPPDDYIEIEYHNVKVTNVYRHDQPLVDGKSVPIEMEPLSFTPEQFEFLARISVGKGREKFSLSDLDTDALNGTCSGGMEDEPLDVDRLIDERRDRELEGRHER